MLIMAIYDVDVFWQASFFPEPLCGSHVKIPGVVRLPVEVSVVVFHATKRLGSIGSWKQALRLRHGFWG